MEWFKARQNSNEEPSEKNYIIICVVKKTHDY